jgi:addiction module RelB/DinJ family antitoxin
MNALFRARIDKRLLRDAGAVCREMGLDTQEAVRLFLVTLVRRRELPFKVTAESAEDELLQPLARRVAILEGLSYLNPPSLTPAQVEEIYGPNPEAEAAERSFGTAAIGSIRKRRFRA